jgi:hypothetical protein
MNKFKIGILAILLVGFMSCSQSQMKIDAVKSKIEKAESNIETVSEQDWTDIDLKMEEMKKDLSMNRSDYTDEQVKEIGNLQGRYTKLMIKKGANDFKQGLKDLKNSIEGFVEGMSDSSNNK